VLDARSDIYSLAVILYEVLTGKLPFDAKTPMEYIQAHVTKAPIGLDDRVAGKKFPSGLGAVIVRALEKAPEKRYASAAEFAQALKPFAGMAGKGFTAMMPRGTAAQLAHVQEIPAAAVDLPVVPIEASKPSVPIHTPRSSVPKTVRMSPVPAAPLPATTPEGKVPVAALAAAAAAAANKRTQPTALMLMGIATGCLVAGILITMLILRLIGPS
jgi:eukaryotic-like serine/threonine-protein kinase